MAIFVFVQPNGQKILGKAECYVTSQDSKHISGLQTIALIFFLNYYFNYLFIITLITYSTLNLYLWEIYYIMQNYNR